METSPSKSTGGGKPLTEIDSGNATRTHRHGDSDTGSGRLEVRCPSCHQPTSVAVDTSLTDLTCPTCGSQFSLVDHDHNTRVAPPLSKMGRFDLIERIGVGGFGSVWKARDKQLDRTVALKIPRAGILTAEEQEKFFREARAAAQLRHPYIVSVHEVGRDGDSVYIVSDFVRGVTLSDWLSGQRLTGREAAELCAKVADALAHAHQQGVVHRDLKPGNIMIDGDNQPHLMDFGLARRDAGEVTVTMDGQVLGTPAYMSPEQAAGEAHTADGRSDIYSLGVILFQLLTGELPFRGNPRMLVHQVIHDPAPTPRKFNANVPKDLETIALKCLEKDPARRFATAADLAAELRRFLAGKPIQARPVSRLERAWRWCKRNPYVTGLSAALVGVLATAVVVLLMSNARIRSESEAKALALQGKDAALATARNAVDQMLVQVGGDKLSDIPMAHPIRQALMEEALRFYDGFVEQGEMDASLGREMATVLQTTAGIQRELGRFDDARGSLERAIAITEQRLAAESNDVDDLQLLALLEQNLAYAWKVTPPGPNDAQVEEHFTKALEVFGRIEAQWPDRPLPSVLCLQFLGDIKKNQGDFASAERLWRDALEKGEKYLAAVPDDRESRSQVCWVCVALADVYLTDRSTLPQAKSALEAGLRHTGVLLAANPESAQARDVDASLNLRLGLLHCRNSQLAAATEAFGKSAREIEELCADFPWNRSYWITAHYAHEETARSLQSLGGTDAIRKPVAEMYRWVSRVEPRVPEEVEPQLELMRSQAQIASLLAGTGKETDARELARTTLERTSKLAQRMKNSDLDQLALAKVRVAAPIEFLPVDEALTLTKSHIRPALVELATAPDEFKLAVHPILDRPWDNWLVSIPVSIAFLSAVNEVSSASKDLASIRLSALERLTLLQYYALQDSPRVVDTVAEAGKLVREFKLEDDRNWLTLNRCLAYAQLNLRHPDEAEAAARTAVQVAERLQLRDPTGIDAYRSLAEVMRYRGNFREAIASFRECWQRAANVGDWEFAQIAFDDWLLTVQEAGDAQLKTTSCGEVLEQLNGFGTGPGRELQRLIWTAQVRACLGEWHEALADCRAAEGLGAKWSELPVAVLIRSLPQESSSAEANEDKSLQELREHLFELARKTPLDDYALNTVSWNLSMRGGNNGDAAELAVELAQKALRLDPGNSNLLNTLGVAYYRAGRWQAAVDALLESQKIAGLSTLGHNAYFLAMAYSKLGDSQRAERWFRTANRWTASFGGTNTELRDFHDEAVEVLQADADLPKVAGTRSVEIAEIEKLLYDADPDIYAGPLADWQSPEAERVRFHVSFYQWQPAEESAATPDWNRMVQSRPVDEIDVDRLDFTHLGYDAPTPKCPSDFFATVAETERVLPAGKYQFSTVADESVRVWVDEKSLIDTFNRGHVRRSDAEIELAEGKHQIRIEHFEREGTARLGFWLRPIAKR